MLVNKKKRPRFFPKTIFRSTAIELQQLIEKNVSFFLSPKMEAAFRVATALAMLGAGALLRAGGLIGEAELQVSLKIWMKEKRKTRFD